MESFVNSVINTGNIKSLIKPSNRILEYSMRASCINVQ